MNSTDTVSETEYHGLSPTDSITAPISMLAFWVAITLPVLYIPLFLAGINTLRGIVVFLALVGFHLVTLIAGHNHAGQID